MSDKSKTGKRSSAQTAFAIVVGLVIGVGLGFGIIAYTESGPTVTQAERDTERAGRDSGVTRGAQGTNLTQVQQGRRNSDAERSLPDLVERLLPAVVSISVSQGDPQARGEQPADPRFRDHFRNGPNRRFGTAVGSGFIVEPQGYIVTNHHVIENAGTVQVILHDRTQLDAEVVGEDPRADLALLRVDTDKDLATVSWGDSSGVRVGERVVAIGNPFGLSSTVTAGIVSARGRFIPSRARQASFVDYIQTDAAINRGNSGGPLFNMRGEVIGINTAIYSNRGTNVGVAFAVPSNIARQVVEQLREYGRTRRGWLGVTIQHVTPEIAQSLGLDGAQGALVANVVPDSPAAQAGILRGDVILRFNGQEVTDHQRLPRIVAGTPSGQDVEVVVWRRNEEVTVEVTLGELETASQQTPGKGDTQPQGPDAEMTIEGMTLSVLTDELRQRFRLDADVEGVMIVGTENGSQAAQAGLEPGNVILEANLNEVATPAAFAEQIEEARDANRSSILLLVQMPGGDKRFVALRIDGG